jgi:hypothetical protein
MVRVDEVTLVFMMKSRAITLNFADGIDRTISNAGTRVPRKYAEKLLGRQVTVGGCCGKPEKTSFLFATPEHIQSGERKWIE